MKKEIIQSYITQAKNHKKTAQDLFSLHHYDWCLFLWHLTIEKLLKALILSQGKDLIYVHDLIKLFKRTGLTQTEEITANLNEISSYNIEARYDDYKHAFYKKTSLSYSKKWIKICEEIYSLLLKST